MAAASTRKRASSNGSTRKGTKKAKAKKVAQAAILFETVDTAEISAILLNKLDGLLKESKHLAFTYADEEVDVGFFSQVLVENFTPKMLSDFMGSAFGQGILMGYIVAAGEQKDKEDAISEAEAAEGNGGYF